MIAFGLPMPALARSAFASGETLATNRTTPKSAFGSHARHLRRRTCPQRNFSWYMTDAPRLTFFATCPRGLGETLAREISSKSVSGRVLESHASGVLFDGDTLATGYAACLWLRTAVRVLHRLSTSPDFHGTDARADDFRALYEFIRNAADWPALLDGGVRSFSVQVREAEPDQHAQTWDPRARRTQRAQPFGSHRAQVCAKDAICDALRDAGCMVPERPESHATSDVPLFLVLHDREATLYRDMAGASLHKRGYRDGSLHKSSLNEAVAAGMLMLAGFGPDGSFGGDAEENAEESGDGRPKSTKANSVPVVEHPIVVDPMCGSGTLLIEAALLRLRVAPGLYRREFPFERWGDFDGRVYDKVVRAAVDVQLADEDLNMTLIGNDVSPASVAQARRDLERTKLARMVRLSNDDAEDLRLRRDATLVVCNPPWGRRIGDEEEAWSVLGRFVKKSAQGGSAMLLSGDAGLTRGLRMRARAKHPIRFGGVDCRAVVYDVLAPPSAS